MKTPTLTKEQAEYIEAHHREKKERDAMKYSNVKINEESKDELKKRYGSIQNAITEAVKVLLYRDKKREEYLKDLKGRLDADLIKGE